jgi:hypothetical protein
VPQSGGAVSTKNILPANVQHNPGSGLYCFSGLSFSPNNVSVTLGADGNAVSQAAELGTNFGCPGGTQVSVFTFDAPTDLNTGNTFFSPTDNGFYIVLN